MLDSDQEPSYNLSKKNLLLPRILKLIEDMIDDSTPLLMSLFHRVYCLQIISLYLQFLQISNNQKKLDYKILISLFTVPVQLAYSVKLKKYT